jgi:hypothetical protein
MARSDEILRLLNRAQDTWDQITPVADTITSASDAALRAINGDLIKSENDEINMIWAVGKAWNQQLALLAQHDENYWTDISGSDLANPARTTRALQNLLLTRKKLIDLRELCEAMKMMVIGVSVTDHMDVKSWGSSMTSLKAVDIEARKQSYRTLDRCIANVDTILPRLTRATEAVENLQDFHHQFLILQHSQNQAADVSRIRAAQGVGARQ